jgi:ABC-type Mn2+/Zn2+ transport system ATPase subunit
MSLYGNNHSFAGGPTGAGKTSLLLALMGQLKHKENAQDQAKLLATEMGGVAYVPQKVRCPFRLRVWVLLCPYMAIVSICGN